MKIDELQAVASKLDSFTFISKARRVENNTIEIMFDKTQSYFFNMTRGHSFIYKAPSQRPIHGYNAPIDTLLHTLLSGSSLLSVKIINSDRVLRISFRPKSSYKNQVAHLQFEFTGKNTNAILIDDDETVIEALRHIDSSSSFRVIRPGVELLDIPPLNNQQKHISKDIEDIELELELKYQKMQEAKLKDIKKQKLLITKKRVDKFTELLNGLPNKKSLHEDATRYNNYGNLILSNLYNIKPYDKALDCYDFQGKQITIKLPKNIKVNRISDYYFNLAKRAKNKANNVHIEHLNLVSKRSFYENIYHALTLAKEPQDLELLVPKKSKSLKRKEKLREGELFWIEGHKVLVGRNSNENQKLLQLAKANDIWMHIRGIPSSHVIIRTDKQNLPDSIISAAAKLCVDFSVKSAGDYSVDYTKRKFIKVQDGSNVLYNKYETISVRKDGIEIRE